MESRSTKQRILLEPLSYQVMAFEMLTGVDVLIHEVPNIIALQLYGNNK